MEVESGHAAEYYANDFSLIDGTAEESEKRRKQSEQARRSKVVRNNWYEEGFFDNLIRMIEQ